MSASRERNLAPLVKHHAASEQREAISRTEVGVAPGGGDVAAVAVADSALSDRQGQALGFVEVAAFAAQVEDLGLGRRLRLLGGRAVVPPDPIRRTGEGQGIFQRLAGG